MALEQVDRFGTVFGDNHKGDQHLATYVYLGSNIVQTCQGLVASFDAEILIPNRKALQELNDSLKNFVYKAPEPDKTKVLVRVSPAEE